ncbi:ADP-ribosylation factor 1-like [Argonauta hians]
MGSTNSTCCQCCSRKSSDLERVLMLGLNASGKSKMLYRLKLDEDINTMATIGFNVEQLQLDKASVVIWDVAGHKRSRTQWCYYYSNTIALIYVIDSSDKDQFEESCRLFMSVIQHPEMQNIPVLILANKQDLASAESVSVISDYFSLKTVLKDRSWFILSVSAVTGHGIVQTRNILNALITEHKK